MSRSDLESTGSASMFLGVPLGTIGKCCRNDKPILLNAALNFTLTQLLLFQF